MGLPRNEEYVYYIEEPSNRTIYTPITGNPDEQASPTETSNASSDQSTGKTIPSINWDADNVTPVGGGSNGDEGVAPPSYPNVNPDPVPVIRYKTVTRTTRVAVEDFSHSALEALHNQGVTFVVIYTDGTEDDVDWTEVYDPQVITTSSITFDADNIGAASNQHFWDDTNGAHVTDNEQDDWNTEYAKTGHGDLANPTDLEPWHNILMNSLGILLRRGLVNLVSFSKSAIAFYDGSGNQNSNITAFFGRNNAQIGRDTEKHLVLNSSGITVYNGDGTVAPLQASNISAAEANIQQLQANTADISTIRANSAKVKDLTASQLNAASGYIESLTTSNVSANDISANKATIASLISGNVTVNTIRAASAFIASLASSNISASNIVADHADISDLKATKVNVSDLEADYITASTIESTYMKADISNADVAWIQNGVIKDGSISNAMIASVSANKLTAGTIDASNITVTNLNADNITTGTINGQRIGEGSLSLSKLEDDVYTEAEVDAKLSNMQTQIDGAIETWTGTAVPTLNNTPANTWTDTATKHNHVGDVYFVVNSSSQQNGYNYRFTESGTYPNTTYSWQLIKDNDVTNALSRLTTAEGKIGTIEQFDSDISSWKTSTDEEISSIKSNHTALAGRVTTAEGTLSTKVDTTTFNTLSQTVEGNTSSIQSLTTEQTTLSGRIDNAQAAIDNIKIGGRNLLRKTASFVADDIARTRSSVPETGIIRITPTSSSGQAKFKVDYLDFSEYGDDAYVVSFDARIAPVESSYTNINLVITFGFSAASRINSTFSSSYDRYNSYTFESDTLSSEWKRFTKVYNVPSDIKSGQSSALVAGSQLCVQFGVSGSRKPVEVRLVKLERGTRATDWTPAPEDVESEITKNTTKINEVTDTVDGHTQRIGSLETTIVSKADSSSLETVDERLNSVSDTVDGHTQSIVSINSTLSSKADGSAVSSLTTRVNNISDTVDGHTSSLSSITSTQTTIQQNAVKSTVQLWFTKANTTAPNKPTAHVTTNNSATGNAWNLVVPTYNASYPNYYYCYEYEYLNGGYGWSAVTRDIATEEAQERARTAITNAATADTKAENAATAASNAQSDIDNLEIGGRNLVLETGAPATSAASASDSAYTTSFHLSNYGDGIMNNTEDDWYCSFDYAVEGNSSSGVDIYFQFHGVATPVTTGRIISGNASGHVSEMFKLTSEQISATVRTCRFRMRFATDGAKFTITNFKLEKGNRATDWTPAPEDIDADISTAQTSADNAQATADKNVKESIQLWITKATNTSPSKPTSAITSTATTGNAWTTVVPIYNDTYPHYFYCMQYKLADDSYVWSDVVYDQATTEAQSVARTTSSNLTTLQNDYATFKQTTQNFESTIGSTYATKTELSTTQTTLQSNIDNIKIGGENLLILDTTQLGRLLADGSVYTTGSNDGQQHLCSDFIKIEPGSKYVLTRYIKDTVRAHAYFYVNWYDIDKQPILRTDVIDYADDDLGYDVFTAPDNAEYVRISMGDRFVSLSAVKFEKGTVPTDWSPSNYDTNNAFNILRGTNQQDVLTGYHLDGSWKEGHWSISSGDATNGGAIGIEIDDFIDNSGFKIRYGFRVWSTTSGNKDVSQGGLINVLKAGLYRLILAVRLTPDQEQTSATLQIRTWGNGAAQTTSTSAITSTEWRIASFSINLTTKYANLDGLSLFIGVRGKGSLDICRIYLKEGYRAVNQPCMTITDESVYLPWRPALEDNAPYTKTNALISAVEERVTTAETSITQTNEAIALKANASDVYTKTQTDGLISTEVSNRNTAIEQSADAVKLFASQTYSSKTETAQMVQPNLSPYFSHPIDDIYNATTNPDGYWRSNLASTYWNVLEDGWAHASCTASSSTKFCNCFVKKIPEDLKPSTVYTFLLEWRNFETTESTEEFIITSNNSTYVDPFADSTKKVTIASANGSAYVKATTSADLSTANTLTRGYLNVSANSTVSGDFRISFYEGDYSGPYKPYVDQSLSSRVSLAEASLTVQAGQIESKVSANGIISSINQTPETIKIQANRVEIDGAAVFSNSDFRSAADNAYDAKGAAADVQDTLEDRIDNSNVVVSVYPVSIDWNTEIATLGVRCIRNGQIITPTGYSWTRDSLTTVLGTTATLEVTDLDAVYNCTVTFNV